MILKQSTEKSVALKQLVKDKLVENTYLKMSGTKLSSGVRELMLQ